MSHELRTPLNSLLILAQMLADNSDGRLAPKQVKFAQTIYQSGTELLALINDILDLSKDRIGHDGGRSRSGVPHGRAGIHASRTFLHVAQEKGVGLEIHLDPALPKSVFTNNKRLQQVLKNLLSNALKFTHTGTVSLDIRHAQSGWNIRHPVLSRSDVVVAFSVTDTGIGIPLDQQSLIFEAFRQAGGAPAASTAAPGWACPSAAS